MLNIFLCLTRQGLYLSDTYVDIISFSPPESEDSPIEERYNEGKRPDCGVDEKSSRAPKRPQKLDSSGAERGEKVVQVVPDILLFKPK